MKSLAGSSLLMMIALLVGSTSSAGADPAPTRPEARKHLAAGNKLYEIKSFEEAIAEYKRGALIESSAIFHYNLGQCYRQLGRYEDAIWHYEQFLAKASPEGEVLAAVNGFISQMRSELDRKAMTQRPTEAVVLPQNEPQAPNSQSALVDTNTSQPWYTDTVGVGLSAAGTIGIGVGIGLIFNARSINDEANRTKSQTVSDSLHDRADRRLLAAYVATGVGTGLLAAGVVKLLVPKKVTASKTQISLSMSRNTVILLGQF